MIPAGSGFSFQDHITSSTRCLGAYSYYFLSFFVIIMRDKASHNAQASEMFLRGIVGHEPGKPPPSLSQALSSHHALHFKHSVCMWLCIEVHINAVLSILPIDFCILLSTGTSFLTSTPKIPTVWTIAECFIGNEFRLNTSLMLHNVPRSLFVLFFCFAPDIFWKLTLTPDDRQRSC